MVENCDIAKHYQTKGLDSFEQLTCREWSASARQHREQLSATLDPWLENRSRGGKDPVFDFLFEYYAFRPSALKTWSPGWGKVLQIEDEPLPDIPELVCRNGIAYLDPEQFPRQRLSSARWILRLLRKSREHKPSFGCFGMHEWAMVYKTEQVRHQQIPLRMSPKEIEQFVDSRPLVCTHFDAYRFLTDPARPKNRHRLSRKRFPEFEQAGCLHTNMDLYKWAFKFHPWISGDLLRKAFFLALEARVIDMKASPYDLRERGLKPIRIETPEGRETYLDRQKEIYRKSIPVRDRLIGQYERLCSDSGPIRWGD